MADILKNIFGKLDIYLKICTDIFGKSNGRHA